MCDAFETGAQAWFFAISPGDVTSAGLRSRSSRGSPTPADVASGQCVIGCVAPRIIWRVACGCVPKDQVRAFRVGWELSSVGSKEYLVSFQRARD